MRALVVYESMFGNTRDIALAIAEGISLRMEVRTIEVAEAPVVIPSDVVLLVVGTPTHVHGMTTPKSRADSAGRAGDRLVSRGTGVREWLDTVRPVAVPVPAVAFDTRLKGPELLWGSAAKATAKLLRELGFRLVQRPRSFLVAGPSGPVFERLVDGELDRAREWGASLVATITTPVPPGLARTRR
jgi:hypothetical protein